MSNISNTTVLVASNGHSLSTTNITKHRTQTTPTTQRRWFRRLLLSVVRIACLDAPLLLILFMYAIILHIEWVGTNYLLPQLKLQIFETHERDITYYHRICTEADQTTYDTADLIVDITGATSTSNSSSSCHSNVDDKTNIDAAVHKMLQHGVTMVPNLISEGTASTLREYILEENKKEDHLIYVIENQNRWSFPIQVDQHPIIATALEEILHQPNLVPYLEAIMGKDPAVIEFTAITQAYGAKQQFWHQDGMFIFPCFGFVTWTIFINFSFLPRFVLFHIRSGPIG
jgi:hypothetical protein